MVGFEMHSSKKKLQFANHLKFEEIYLRRLQLRRQITTDFAESEFHPAAPGNATSLLHSN